MKPAIRVENLSKQYRLGVRSAQSYRMLREAIVDTFTGALRRLRGRGGDGAGADTFYALKDVSFEVQPGEVVGIIGRNGAGKSTLLKVLSRITEPTEGRVEIRGRIGSLLEVGTGFHPELTGRENIYMNGSILGMTRREIARKFDEIVAFSEIEQFLDTPVKRYSSGMYVRLAFAVAAHLEPEILIVDEVLAVGDVAFQKKCLGKMGDVARQGRTVLFVSHNMQVVSALTQQCYMLSGGRCVAGGPTLEVISEYLRQMVSTAPLYTGQPSATEPRVLRVELVTSQPNNVQENGKPMEVRILVAAPGPIDGARLSFQVLDSLQRPAIHVWTYDSERPMCREAGLFEFVCRIPNLHLYVGQYTLTVRLSERFRGRLFETLEGICPFDVVIYGKDREGGYHAGACCYLEEFDWSIQKLAREPQGEAAGQPAAAVTT